MAFAHNVEGFRVAFGEESKGDIAIFGEKRIGSDDPAGTIFKLKNLSK